MSFCEFYAISKNIFSYRTPPMAASVNYTNRKKREQIRSAIGPIRIGVAPKNDFEILFLSTIKIYCYFLFIFSIVLIKAVLSKLSKVTELI